LNSKGESQDDRGGGKQYGGQVIHWWKFTDKIYPLKLKMAKMPSLAFKSLE
jgi:hypothetical protein